MKKIGWVTGGVVAVAALGYAMAKTGPLPAQGQASASSTTPSKRRAAPDFQVRTLEGQTLQLSALKGKVILLDFWATWCPPCRAEVPHLRQLYAQYQPKGLEIIGVSLDRNGEDTVRSFVQQNGLLYPVAMGEERLTSAYGGIVGIPTAFLIDKQGSIVKKYVGYQDKSVFEQEIRRLLEE